LLANGMAVFFIYIMTSLRFYGQYNQKKELFWFYFALMAIVPILGILLEFARSRFAKWVNVGYWTFVVVMALGLTFFWDGHHFVWRHHFFAALLDWSLAYPVAVAAVTYFLYSGWWLPQTGT
jgi:hypothetical protein